VLDYHTAVKFSDTYEGANLCKLGRNIYP